MKKLIQAPNFTGFDGSYDYGYTDNEMYNFEEIDGDFFNWLESTDQLYIMEDKIDEQIDWKSSYIEFAKTLTSDVYEPLFSEIAKNTTFSHLYQPKEYNFETDEIYFYMELSNDRYNWLKNYCLIENKEKFTTFLKEKYSSRDGFVSFVETDINDFETELNDELDNDSDEVATYFGILVDFYVNHYDSLPYTLLGYDRKISDSDIECMCDYIVNIVNYKPIEQLISETKKELNYNN